MRGLYLKQVPDTLEAQLRQIIIDNIFADLFFSKVLYSCIFL